MPAKLLLTIVNSMHSPQNVDRKLRALAVEFQDNQAAKHKFGYRELFHLIDILLRPIVDSICRDAPQVSRVELMADLQEIVYRNIGRIAAGEVECPTAWMRVVARHHFLHLQRTHTKQLTPVECECLLSREGTPEQNMQELDMIAALCRELSHREREIIRNLVEGCKTIEIAEKLHIHRGTVHRHIVKLRRKAKQFFDRYSPELRHQFRNELES